MGDYQIILNSAGYFDKGVLTVEDLAEIDEKIDAQYPQIENVEEVVEDTTENVDEVIVEAETTMTTE